MELTDAQKCHVQAVFPECRAQMSEYLSQGVEVVIYLQNECGDDVPPYAVAPRDNQEFWIGCWDTPELASAGASALGLRVVSP
ncbi:hypothetical protein [Pseudomonas syringae]|uniref:hypothetical protein n=1 Tax=Pseudomonas syringae TaxID=317 RepID=UPI001F2E5B67|nr:hypothetical protein [Pseudomonas syringae]MCF5371981.1 hypothetical protein [Pseudomonas syringae]MCF5382022.1 hypothetical protein [Pseudomonas syringae]MCF5419445.1 hypothetical protein [Pseudomonas syringae]MCF5451991.1 hypothetical protein [Pseudomonas syringae]MCF5456278.1 hypothetical protein [Pseudomonas syringae]